MVQSRFLLSVAVIVVVTVLDHNNCNAGITTKVRDGFINGISTYDLADFDRKNNPIKWLKRQVRKLKKELGEQLYNREGYLKKMIFDSVASKELINLAVTGPFKQTLIKNEEQPSFSKRYFAHFGEVSTI